MSDPTQTRELLADAVVHACGLTAAFVGVTLLIQHLVQSGDTAPIISVSVYSAMLLFALMASAAYHLLPWDASRNWFHKVDHAAIYLKIAGTYTPLVVIIGSTFSYVVLAAIWGVALFGAVAKLSFWPTNAKGSLALYLGLGWACVLLIYPMLQTLPGTAIWLITGGGLLYTVGTYFFSREVLPFQNAIWHCFVLAASTCFFAAISISATA